jgi:uncharacterized membrane protein
MSVLFAAAAAFFLLHLIPSTPVRAGAVSIVGEGAYRAAFSILSLIAIWWMAREFEAAPYGEKLWIVPSWWPWVQAALILFAFVLAVGGVSAPNPSAPGGAKALSGPGLAGGVFAITRHPVMWGAAIWAMTHMISQATTRGLLFFGAFAATALIGIWLQQKRKRTELPGWDAFEAKTSYFPFAAILEGRAKLSIRAIGWWRPLFAVLLWAAILHFHYWLFGVRSLPLV